LQASLDCRALSLYVVVAQISSANPLMQPHIPSICSRLQARSVLSQPTAGAAGAADFHRELINAVSVVLDAAPEKLVNGAFRPVMQYLVRSVDCDSVYIATIATDFWVKYASAPADRRIRRQWMTAFNAESPTLIRALMDHMVYHPAYSDHLEQTASGPERYRSLPREAELRYNLREVAASAFEHIAQIYSDEVLCATFRPLLETRLESEAWEIKEAAILALAAYTEGAGTPDVMRDCYCLVVPRVIDCYADERPLLRSVACFAMTKLVGHRLRGIKDPWPRVLTCTARATRDSCAEVRSTAIRSLSSLLAYGTANGVGGVGRSNDVGGHASRLVDDLVRAEQCEMDPESRAAYFECVSHLVGRLVPISWHLSQGPYA